MEGGKAAASPGDEGSSQASWCQTSGYVGKHGEPFPCVLESKTVGGGEVGSPSEEACPRLPGADHLDTPFNMGKLTSTYKEKGPHTEIEELESQVKGIRLRLLGLNI